MSGSIKAFSNCDHVIVAWNYNSLIANCIGFALYKATNGEPEATAEPLPNRIGFAGQDPKPGEQRPSTEWPIQRFLWTDYDVNYGDTVSYMVVPMLINGTAVVKDTANATAWSATATVGTDTVDEGPGYETFFNRGIISSQFMSRQIANLKATDKKATLDDTLKDENSTIRKFLGGVLVEHLFAALDEVVKDSSLSIYSALYELNELNVIERFKEIGNRANIILANGAFSKKNDDDENQKVRGDIRSTSKVNLYDRIVTGEHFAHNKFIVFCKDGAPFKVWTGSTNLTENGLYTQVNNAVIITNKDVAKWYLDEWKQIQEAGNAYPDDYIAYNTEGHAASGDITTWFAPVKNLVDMTPATDLINNAKEGILFLMFNPGTQGTLYNAILNMIGTPQDLFIHGIMNQNPFGKVHPLVFTNKGTTQETSFDAVLPKSITDEFAFWSDEIHGKMVVIHSKVVVIDPFGAKPVVMFGSHNMGPKASRANDDNLNIVIGNSSLARQYAVNILSVYDHFHWRYSVSQQTDPTKRYQGLSTDPNWMKEYHTGVNVKELNFLGL
jgi:phosphatidylserine/phosphatidylglycerophosphate/cardiolipin synthase-like enzyme